MEHTMQLLPPDSVALVTGSGRGLGRRIAETLAEAGAAVVVHDQYYEAPSVFGEAPNIDAVVDDFRRRNAEVIGVTADVANYAEMEAAVRQAETALGPITILVNAAGGDIGAAGKGKPNPNDALGIPPQDLQAIFNRNLIGTIQVCKLVVPGMIARHSGSIVNIASIAALFAVSPEVAYAVAKAGITHYTRCLARELRPVGVRANVIAPGPTKTARFMATRVTDPVKMDEVQASLDRYANPAEIADATLFFCSRLARFVTGQVLAVDGGLTLHPY
jgi:3-oxoacyl-[acyl-carrier protein] reductase